MGPGHCDVRPTLTATAAQSPDGGEPSGTPAATAARADPEAPRSGVGTPWLPQEEHILADSTPDFASGNRRAYVAKPEPQVGGEKVAEVCCVRHHHRHHQPLPLTKSANGYVQNDCRPAEAADLVGSKSHNKPSVVASRWAGVGDDAADLDLRFEDTQGEGGP